MMNGHPTQINQSSIARELSANQSTWKSIQNSRDLT